MISAATNCEFPGLPLTHIRSRFTDDDHLTLQSRYLVTGRYGDIAKKVGIHLSTVAMYGNGSRHVPAFRAFAISQEQGDFRFLQLLAERAGAILLPQHPSIARWSGIQLLTMLVLGFGRFLVLAEKVNAGEELPDDEMQELIEEGDKIKQAVDALIHKAMKQRARTQDTE